MQKYIAEKVNPDEQYVWARNHIRKGLEALEKLLHDYAGKYATGDEVYLADCFIAPQLYGAIKRFSLDMTPYPLLSRLNEAYNQLPAFVDSAPENQPDTPASSVEQQKKLKLYSNFQSTCSHRVRIALKLKEFTKLNPIGYVPVLVDEDFVVSDSFAILLYLEEKYPQHPLLPRDLQRRAINYQVQVI
ncbi:hypothetical protein RHGRI_032080 [Rhododendron griersonianum]|uniref:Glutathione S-transferase n=1 Tax=Rhododendron griersonianum TaxID=479676 RepID=A0AAV6IG74_9ERIC|nr:hypothetical protein RHGRI_032080 [Rhododendron griersonianum]